MRPARTQNNVFYVGQKNIQYHLKCFLKSFAFTRITLLSPLLFFLPSESGEFTALQTMTEVIQLRSLRQIAKAFKEYFHSPADE